MIEPTYLCSMQPFLQDLFKNQDFDPKNFFLIAGPCVIEDQSLIEQIAAHVSCICKELGIPYVFKASYRKANRTSASSFTGLGDELGLDLLKKTGAKFNLPTTTRHPCGR